MLVCEWLRSLRCVCEGEVLRLLFRYRWMCELSNLERNDRGRGWGSAIYTFGSTDGSFEMETQAMHLGQRKSSIELKV